MSWRIERWIKPKRDRNGELLRPGRWMFFENVATEKEAEKLLRAVAKSGGIIKATTEGVRMCAHPSYFSRWRTMDFDNPIEDLRNPAGANKKEA
jgi:hypothetical protein